MNFLLHYSFLFYNNSSGQVGSSRKSHGVYGVAVDAVATPLNKFANISNIFLPPLLLNCLNLYKNLNQN